MSETSCKKFLTKVLLLPIPLSSEISGGEAGEALDDLGEELDVVVAHHLGDLGDRLIGGGEETASLHHPVVLQIVDKGDAHVVLEALADIGKAVVEAACQILKGQRLHIVLRHVGDDQGSNVLARGGHPGVVQASHGQEKDLNQVAADERLVSRLPPFGFLVDEGQELADLSVVIVKDHTGGVLYHGLHIKMKEIMLQEHTQALGALEDGVEKIGQKETVNVLNGIAVQTLVGVAASVVYDQVVSCGECGDLPIQRVLDAPLQNIAQLQKGMVVQRDLLVIGVGHNIEFFLLQNGQKSLPVQRVLFVFHKNAPYISKNVG